MKSPVDARLPAVVESIFIL